MSKLKSRLLWLLGSFLMTQLMACSGSPLKNDEDIVFFPTSANQLADGNWNVPIHHWVFEKEENDLSRRITQKVFSEMFEGIGISEEQADSPLLKQRMMWFLVDNERNKKININLADQQISLHKTSANGHAFTQVQLDSNYIKPGEWLIYQAIVPGKHKGEYTGEVQFIPEKGLSVISDIDDTIKVSDVLDKKKLIKNTFVEPYQATYGFPQYYATLQQKGAYFHYVSASPWQLYPSLKRFLDSHYPKGTVTLRNFRIKDSSLFAFLKSSADYKIKHIRQIIKRYPKHQFILIGDSGEHDPEVYATIYELFPNNIQSIGIRSVEGSDLSPERFKETFKHVPRKVWSVFKTPQDSPGS